MRLPGSQTLILAGGHSVPLPFDATLKDLVRSYARDWLAALGHAAATVEPVSPDVSSFSAATDVVFRLDGSRLIHYDFQSRRDPTLARRLLSYNAMLHLPDGLPVHSVAVLLVERADDASLTGSAEYSGVPGRGRTRIEYEVVRVWRTPAEELLSGPRGLVPLAPLGRLPAGRRGLAGVVGQVVERLQADGDEEARRLLTASYILTGMRTTPERATRYFQGVRAMRDSSTFQAILEEGRTEGRTEGRAEGELREARRVILRVGRTRLGPAPAAAESTLEAVADLGHLERMVDAALAAASWDELLATP